MKAGYYPGCSLEGTARLDYSESLLGVCSALGIDLEEMPDWSCCGATAAHSIHKKAGIGLAARNLNIAAEMDCQDLLVPCPMCFNRLKVAAHVLKDECGSDYDISLKEPMPEVWDLATFFATKKVIEIIKAHIKKPLDGLKVVCYYGCMANRPPKITETEDFEDPQCMDDIVGTLGGEPLQWPYKTDCCGASLVLSQPDIAFRLVDRLYDMAIRMGAKAIVVSCQMCQANLDMYQENILASKGTTSTIPIYYFTELIGVACGVTAARKWLIRHIANPFTLLREMGLLK